MGICVSVWCAKKSSRMTSGIRPSCIILMRRLLHKWRSNMVTSPTITIRNKKSPHIADRFCWEVFSRGYAPSFSRVHGVARTRSQLRGWSRHGWSKCELFLPKSDNERSKHCRNGIMSSPYCQYWVCKGGSFIENCCFDLIAIDFHFFFEHSAARREQLV